MKAIKHCLKCDRIIWLSLITHEVNCKEWGIIKLPESCDLWQKRKDD